MDLAALAHRWDERLERWSDRLNPIVVREVRQSMKTRMFLVVFLLLLGTTWLLSSVMILSNSSRMAYYELGAEFCEWYVIGLLFCLIFAAPFGAFFSMVQEFRDRAFEVLAVSTLTPNKIIFGKLQGSMVMMIIYASAIAPYLCLSYLLGGVSLLDLSMILTWIFTLSIGMSLFAVMLGSLAQKPWIEIVNLIVLFIAAWIAAMLMYGTLTAVLMRGWESMQMWIGLACFAAFVGFVALLSFAVAQSQLTTTYLPINYRRHLGPGGTLSPVQVGTRHGITPGNLPNTREHQR